MAGLDTALYRNDLVTVQGKLVPTMASPVMLLRDMALKPDQTEPLQDPVPLKDAVQQFADERDTVGTVPV